MLIIRAVQLPGVLELGLARRPRGGGACICDGVTRIQVRGVLITLHSHVIRDFIAVGGERVRLLLEVRLVVRSVVGQL